MPTRRNFVLSLSALGAASTAWACPVPVLRNDAPHSVLMLNAACGDTDTPNVFTPAILHIDLGDSVTFVPTDGGHNAASKRGMIPEGAKPWNGAIDEELTVSFTVPGVYGCVCLPHYEMGMVGVIIVGEDLSNLEKAKKVRHPGAARKAFRRLLSELEA
ncbi:pseudoazurin [uncultured Pelagimonas sp.]|uniref:pseudoazurin n=1 Tax=uncultured Pelagimonas sp. TaxID=1618102 RepID=UPI002625C69A|nr:pseudoazurin [uncultured Pelagimonas sp.]